MGWLFRKSVKIFPGIRLNFGKKGLTSATVGKGLFSTNISPKGVRHRVSIPNTGLAYESKRTPLITSAAEMRSDRSLSTSQVWECGRCHSLAPAVNNFCGNCGAHSASAIYHHNAPEMHPHPVSNSNVVRNSWLLLGGILVGVIGLCAFAGLISSPRPAPTNSMQSSQPRPIAVPEASPSPASSLTTLKGKARNKKATPVPSPPIQAETSTPYSPYSRPDTSQGRLSSRRGSGEMTATRSGYIRGPRGGCYYINSRGNKTYVDRSRCN